MFKHHLSNNFDSLSDFEQLQRKQWVTCKKLQGPLACRLDYTPIRIRLIGAELNKLKTWELSSLSSTTPLGAETIQMGLVRLAELYICVVELIHSPLTQQALHNHHGKLAEEALDLSVELLDACGTARDLFLIMKEHVQELQSAYVGEVEIQALKTILMLLFALERGLKRMLSSPLEH